MLKLFPLAIYILALSIIYSGEMYPESKGVPAYIITNDDTVYQGDIICFKDGFFYLQMPKEIIKFSPKDFKGIYFSKKSVHTAKAFFKLYNTISKDKSLNFKQFLQATLAATRISHQAIEQNNRQLIRNIIHKAQRNLENPDALLEPRKFSISLAAALIPHSEDKTNMAITELEEYKKSVNEEFDKDKAKTACNIADILILLIKTNIR